MLRPKLESLQKELERINAPVLKYFRKGLSADEIAGQFIRMKLSPTPELIELYSWWDGQNYEGVPGGLTEFHGEVGVFMPLSDAIDYYDRFWKNMMPDYFPIFSDDTLLINLNPLSRGYKKIYLYSPGLLIIEPEEVYGSLEIMFATFTGCFRDKIFSYNADNYFDVDYERWPAFALMMNPGTSHWQRMMNSQG